MMTFEKKVEATFYPRGVHLIIHPFVIFCERGKCLNFVERKTFKIISLSWRENEIEYFVGKQTLFYLGGKSI